MTGKDNTLTGSGTVSGNVVSGTNNTLKADGADSYVTNNVVSQTNNTIEAYSSNGGETLIDSNTVSGSDNILTANAKATDSYATISNTNVSTSTVFQLLIFITTEMLVSNPI